MNPEMGTAASGFILTIVQTVKTFIPKEWYDWFLPLLAIALGVCHSVWVSPDPEMSTVQGVFEGLRNGAGAVGLFATAYGINKAVKGKKK